MFENPVRRCEICPHCKNTTGVFFARSRNGAWFHCVFVHCGGYFHQEHPRPLAVALGPAA